MTLTPELLAVGAIALVLGVVCTVLLLRRPPDLSGAVATLEERVNSRQSELDRKSTRLAAVEADMAALQEIASRYREQIAQLQTTLEQERRQGSEKLALLSDSREQMTLQFKAIAADILEDKSRRFAASNKESIGEILRPLSEKILHFEKKSGANLRQGG